MRKTQKIVLDPNLPQRETRKDLLVLVLRTGADRALDLEIVAEDLDRETGEKDQDPEIDRPETGRIDRDPGIENITEIGLVPETGSIDPLDRARETGDAIEGDRVTGTHSCPPRNLQFLHFSTPTPQHPRHQRQRSDTHSVTPG